MPPKKQPLKKGRKVKNDDDPDDAPDFLYAEVQAHIDTFLNDSRDSRRGGAGLNPQTLLLRRSRAAIQVIHQYLNENPGSSVLAFAWVWGLVRQMLVRIGHIWCLKAASNHVSRDWPIR